MLTVISVTECHACKLKLHSVVIWAGYSHTFWSPSICKAKKHIGLWRSKRLQTKVRKLVWLLFLNFKAKVLTITKAQDWPEPLIALSQWGHIYDLIKIKKLQTVKQSSRRHLVNLRQIFTNLAADRNKTWQSLYVMFVDELLYRSDWRLIELFLSHIIMNQWSNI